jgi:hypothetical protein
MAIPTEPIGSIAATARAVRRRRGAPVRAAVANARARVLGAAPAAKALGV